VPAFYAKPQTIAEMIDQTLGRVLDLFGLETGLVKRWGEPSGAEDRPEPRDTGD
jgi:4-hydroxy-3-polyprenylbenzoate decarboxylase